MGAPAKGTLDHIQHVSTNCIDCLFESWGWKKHDNNHIRGKGKGKALALALEAKAKGKGRKEATSPEQMPDETPEVALEQTPDHKPKRTRKCDDPRFQKTAETVEAEQKRKKGKLPDAGEEANEVSEKDSEAKETKPKKRRGTPKTVEGQEEVEDEPEDAQPLKKKKMKASWWSFTSNGMVGDLQSKDMIYSYLCHLNLERGCSLQASS